MTDNHDCGLARVNNGHGAMDARCICNMLNVPNYPETVFMLCACDSRHVTPASNVSATLRDGMAAVHCVCAAA